MSAQPPTVVVKIITLLSDDENYHQLGIYSLSIDIASPKTAEQVMKNRQKENEKYSHNKIIQSMSTEELLELKDGRCDIIFKISGALKPKKSLAKGQNVIQYNTKKEEIRRTIFLVPTHDGSALTTTITFTTSDGIYLHEAIIKDIQTMQSQRDGGREEVSAEIKCVSTNSKIGSSNTLTNYESNESRDIEIQSGRAIDRNVQAEPFTESQLDEKMGHAAISGNTTPDFVSLSSSLSYTDLSSQTSSITSTSSTNQTNYGKILSNKSLLVLAGAVPNDGKKLAIRLRVSHQAIQAHHTNHPCDVIQANYLTLLDWRQEYIGSLGEEGLYKQLLKELESIKRNDLKQILEMVLKQNRDLEDHDFK